MQTHAMDVRNFSYWEAELPPAPPPRELPSRVDVLIVGAGFMGRWLAYFLSRLPRPPRVLVIERDRFSYGASTRNAGFLTCGQVSEMMADAKDFSVDAVLENLRMRLHGIRIVREEFPELEVDACGSTDYDEVTDETREFIRRANQAAGEDLYSVRAARIGGDVRQAVYNRADGGLHPVRLLRLLQGRSGAEFAFGVRAESVADGVARLSTPGGVHEVRYSRAFICVNAFARDLDASSIVQPARGQIIITSPVQCRTDKTLGYLDRGYDYFRFVDGRLLIGGGRQHFESEATGELKPTEDVLAYLKQTAARVIGHQDWQVEHHWAGVMGFPKGRHLGGSPRRRIDESTEVVAGFGGMGVALTPAFAREIATEFSGGSAR